MPKRPALIVLLVATFLCTLGLAMPMTTSAAIPKIINFQGKITKTGDGTNVADGNYDMEFKIYDQATGGTLLWTEDWVSTTTQVSLASGVFTVKLGSLKSLANVDFTTGSLYLTVNFNPGGGFDGEMLPRKQLVTAPFAFNANSVVGDGRIGITTTSTTMSAMQVTYNPDTATATPAAVITASANVTGPALKVLQNGTGAAALFTGGSVGVGTTTPGALLAVASASQTQTTMLVVATSSQTSNIFTVASSSGTSFFTVGANGSSTFSTLTNGLVRSSSGSLYNGSVNLASSTDVSGVLAVSNGGTGTSTAPTIQGQLLADDGTHKYMPASLMAGTNITINTSTPGQITITASGSAGVTASGTPGMLQFYGSAGALNANSLLAWDNANLKFSVGTTATSSVFSLQGKAGAGDLLDIATSTGVSFLHITGSGNVGIATANPVSLLTVGGSTKTGTLTLDSPTGSGNGPVVYFRTNGVVNNYLGLSSGIHNLTTTDLELFLASGNNFIVNGAGSNNVGIGTTSPVARLSLTGTATIDPFDVSSTSGVSMFRITQNGNVGIGTTGPLEKLSVNGNAGLLANGQLRFYRSNNANWAYAKATDNGTSQDLGFFVSGDTADVTINKNGNVGVGTSTAGYLFTVAGTSFHTGNAAFASLVGVGVTNPTQLLTVGSSSPVTISTLGNINVATLTASSLLVTDAYKNLISSNLSVGNIVTGVSTTTSGNLFNASISSNSLSLTLPSNLINSVATTSNSGTFYVSTASTGSTNSLTINFPNNLVTSVSGSGSIGSTGGTAPTIQLLSMTSGDILYGQGTNTFATSSSFTYSGSNLFVLGGGLYATSSNVTNASSTNLTVSGSAYLTGLTGQNCIGTSVSGLLQAGSCGGTNYWSTVAGGIFNNNGYMVGVNSSTPTANMVVEGSSTYPTVAEFIVASSTHVANFMVNAAGNVGIGTTTPQAALTVVDVPASATSMIFQVGSTTSTSMLIVQGNGNVGIGSASPSQLFAVGSSNQFTVNGTGVATATSLTLTGLTGQNCIGTSASGLLQTGVCGGGTNYWSLLSGAVYNNSGYMIGINTSTPTATLFVQGSSTYPSLTLLTVASSSGASYLTVLSGGNVGIGTSTPLFTLSVNGSGSFNTLKTSDLSTGNAMIAFGDSITYGYGLTSPATTSWVNLFAAAKNWALTNDAVSGNMCPDQATYVMQQNPATTSIFSWLVGYNDMRIAGASSTLQNDYRNCLMGSLAWLAVPAAQKMTGQNASTTTTGTWTNTTQYGGTIGKDTAVPGSTITFVTKPGQTVYVYGMTQNPNTSVFSVSIDGVVVATGLTEAGTVNTENSITYAPMVWRFTGLNYQPHTVVVTATAPDATNHLHILGAGVAGDYSSSETGPLVYAANILRMSSVGYTQTCSPLNCNNGSDSVVGSFDTIVSQTVSQLQNDGLNVSLVDVTNSQAYDPNASPSQLQADNVHPNVLGHANIANAFISQSTMMSLPKDRRVSGTMALLNSANNFTGQNYFTNLKAADMSVGNAMTVFGDSLTTSYNLAASSTGWQNQFAAAKNWTLTNDAVNGTLCADEATYVMQQNPATSSIFSWMTGFNDMRVDGVSNTNGQKDYKNCLFGSLAWLAIPASQKVTGQSASGVSTTGTWITTSVYGGGIGKSTNVAGSTITFTTAPGQTVYLYGLIQNPNTSVFSVSIDGVVVATGLTEAGTVNSESSASYAPTAWRFTGLNYQPHTVVVTATAPDAAQYLHILGVGVASDYSSSESGPMVYAANIPRMNSTGYAQTCAPLNCNNGSDAAVGVFDGIVSQVVSQLQNDGLNVSLVDVTNTQAFDPNASPSQILADNIHPNVLGMTNIANAFISQSTMMSLPKDRRAANTVALLTSTNNFTAVNYFATNIGIGTTSATAMLFLQGTSTTPLLSVVTSSTLQSLYVSNLGNVGIGTTTTNAMLQVAGTAVIQPTTNTNTAFQVLNANGTPLLLVDTTPTLGATTTNFISNPGFEVSTSTWVASGTVSTIARVSTHKYAGLNALKIDNYSTAAYTGATTNGFTATPTAGTYVLSFYARTDTSSSTFSALSAGFSTSTQFSTCTLNSTFVSNLGWNRYSCSFTVSGPVTGIFIGQNDANNRTFYIDAVQLQLGSAPTPYSIGNIQLRGVINSPVVFQSLSNSVTSFQIQDQTGLSNLFIVNSLNGRIEVGSSTATSRFSVQGQSGSGDDLMDVATTTGASFFHITANGRVGMGTTTPDSGLKIMTTQPSALSIASTTGTTLFDVRNISSTFGMDVVAGAFVARNSYFGEEYSQYHSATLSVAASGSTVQVRGQSSTLTGNTASNGTVTATYTLSATSSCAFYSLNTLNGVETILASSTPTALARASCNEAMTTNTGTVALAMYNPYNYPVVAIKASSTTLGLANLGNGKVYLGIADTPTASATPPNNGIIFTNCMDYSCIATSTNWIAMVINNKTVSTTSCSSILVGKYAAMRFEVVANNKVNFFLDNDVSTTAYNTSCGSITTALPNVNMTMMEEIVASGIQKSELDIDYFRSWQDDAPLDPANNPKSSLAIGQTGAPDLTTYAALSQKYPAIGDIQNGSLVSWDIASSTSAKASSKPYDSAILGVAVPDGSLALNDTSVQSRTGGVLVAVNGRASVRVTAKNGDIEPGDYITSSDIPGVAMRATKAGAVVGRALSGFSGSGEGTIAIVVAPQDFNGLNIQHEIPGLALDNSSADAVKTLRYFIDNPVSTSTSADLSVVFTDKIYAGLELVTPRVTTQTVAVDEIEAATGGGITINGDTYFIGRPYFTSDTAGFAVVRQGDSRVAVNFDSPYLDQPVVSASITQADSTSTPDAANIFAQSVFANNMAFVITNKSEKGFVIVLNKPAPVDISFSWIALAVRGAKTFSSKDPSLPLSPQTAEVSVSTPGQPSVPGEPAVAGDATISPAAVLPPVDNSGIGTSTAAAVSDATSSMPAAATSAAGQDAPAAQVEVPASQNNSAPASGDQPVGASADQPAAAASSPAAAAPSDSGASS